jgi:hypothetical protein
MSEDPWTLFCPRSGSRAEELDHLGAVLVLGHAEAPEERAARRLAVEDRGRFQIGGGDGGDLLDRRRVVAREQLLDRLPAFGARGDERGVGEPFAEDHVAEPEGDGGVGARPGREVDLTVIGQLDPPRVDRDQLAAAQRRLLDPRADDRVALRRVDPHEDGHLGVVEVGEGAGRAGEAEGPAQRVGGRRVADPRAVVDVVGADRAAHQPRHRVAVLVGGPGRGEAGDRVGTVRVLDPRQFGDDPVERRLPARRAQLAVDPDQRRRQPVRGPREAVREAPLQAGVAVVGRAVQCRADRDHAPVDRPRLQPAADPAVAAGRRRDAVESLRRRCLGGGRVCHL